MSTFLRWFSPAYRYAVKAEAEGRYIEAARAYALSGEPLKVAEMHVLEAECRGAPESALRELHVAAHFAQQADDSPAARQLLSRLGQIYLRVLKKSVLSPADRDLCSEAAQVLLRAGDPQGAAEAYELGGQPTLAAQAYEQAGDIDKVETLLGRIETQRQIGDAEVQLQKTFELQCDLGQRREALETIDKLCAMARDPTSAQQQRRELRARILPPFAVRLRLSLDGAAAEVLYLGRLPVILGRDPQPGGADAGGSVVPLGDPGLSRNHAQIERSDDGLGLSLRDLGSKNGTSLGGIPVAGVLPLRGEGEIGLGRQVALRYQVNLASPVAAAVASNTSQPATLRLQVSRGMSRGLRVELCAGPVPLGLGQHEPDDAAGVALSFDERDGQPCLHAAGPLLLGGKRIAGGLLLLRGDAVEAGKGPARLRIEVL